MIDLEFTWEFGEFEETGFILFLNLYPISINKRIVKAYINNRLIFLYINITAIVTDACEHFALHSTNLHIVYEYWINFATYLT